MTLMTGSGIRRLAQVVVTALIAAASSLFVQASPASAAAWIDPPKSVWCDTTRFQVNVAPPRVGASYKTEQVGWGSVLQRWNGSAWVDYVTYTNYASFNTFGFSVTSWSAMNTTRGGMYVNNYMRYPVSHRGFYRIHSAVVGNQGGATWQGLVDGGSWCQI